MSDLQKLGQRLDNTLNTIIDNRPDLQNRFQEYIINRFILLIDSNTSRELENQIIKSLNGWLDLLDMEMKNLFEFK